jgi:hypothetical protein
MLPESLDRLLATTPEGARVLDVGGWARPLARADAVLDLMPYATRGAYGGTLGPGPERFGPDGWVQRDVCDRAPWPFPDGHFDVAVCSHTLEDVRDPVWVCSELQRVARSGYVEVPARIEEQTWGIVGPFAGWAHHHWLCDVDPAAPAIEFVFKSDAVHEPGHHVPLAVRDALPERARVQGFFWTGGFAYAERVHYDIPAFHAYLRAPLGAHADAAPGAGRRARLRRRLARGR